MPVTVSEHSSAQGALLDDLEGNVDQTQGTLASQNSRMKVLLRKTKDRWFYCAISEAPMPQLVARAPMTDPYTQL